MKRLKQFSFLMLFMTLGLNLHAATIKLATIAPEGSVWMNDLRAAAKEIKARTDGRVKIKVYGGGVMGSDNAVMRKIRIGQLHGGIFTAGTMSAVYKDINAYGLPFLFTDDAEADYVRSKLDPVMMQGLKDNGFQGFGIATAGFGQLMAPERFEKLNDLKGKKLWVPEDDDMSFQILQGLGLSPVKLPLTDVLTGLQTKLLDVVGSSSVAAIALQWHTKVKYVFEQPLVYIYGTLVIDDRIFSKLSAPDQAVVKEKLTEVYLKFDLQNRKDNIKAESAMKAMNIEFIQASDEMKDIITQVEGMNQSIVEQGMLSEEMFAELNQHLVDYRTAQSE